MNIQMRVHIFLWEKYVITKTFSLVRLQIFRNKSSGIRNRYINAMDFLKKKKHIWYSIANVSSKYVTSCILDGKLLQVCWKILTTSRFLWFEKIWQINWIEKKGPIINRCWKSQGTHPINEKYTYTFAAFRFSEKSSLSKAIFAK